MKLTRKLIFLPPLLPALLALLIAVTDAGARADTSTPAPALHLFDLKPLAGEYLNVFYVSASDAGIGTLGRQLHIDAILISPIRTLIPSDGVIDLPTTEVPRIFVPLIGKLSFPYHFNFVYFAITGDQPNPLYLRNENGTPVHDPRATADELAQLKDADFHAEHTGFISLDAIQQLQKKAAKASPPSPFVPIDMLKDIQQ